MTQKNKIIQDLALARAELGAHLQSASEELNPKAVITRSVSQHPWIWIGAASVSGLLLVRIIMPARRGKIERDNSTASATKSGLIALILSSVLAMVKQNAWKYGSRYLQTYLTEHFSRHEGERPRA
jgi:hypothetical protein